MSSQVTLPRLGQGMESGTIVRWLKAEGDQVEKGEPLYELDTEKVTQEVEADSSGRLLKILAGEGEEIEVGKAIAVIGEPGEEVPDRRPEAAPAEAEPARRVEPSRRRRARARRRPSPLAPRARTARTAGGEGLAAGPPDRARARHRPLLAPRHRPRGPDRRRGRRAGRRRRRPSRLRAASSPPAGEVEVVPLTGMRKTIARRMTEAWEAPGFQITMTADMTAAIRLREGSSRGWARATPSRPTRTSSRRSAPSRSCAIGP